VDRTTTTRERTERTERIEREKEIFS